VCVCVCVCARGVHHGTSPCVCLLVYAPTWLTLTTTATHEGVSCTAQAPQPGGAKTLEWGKRGRKVRRGHLEEEVAGVGVGMEEAVLEDHAAVGPHQQAHSSTGARLQLRVLVHHLQHARKGLPCKPPLPPPASSSSLQHQLVYAFTLLLRETLSFHKVFFLGRRRKSVQGQEEAWMNDGTSYSHSQNPKFSSESQLLAQQDAAEV
jgi:hypothetical protein